MAQAKIPKFSKFQRVKLITLGILKWKIPTYTTAKELLQLYRLANSLKRNSIAVEIGSYIGASSLMIAKGLRRKSKLYCIDTWENDAMSEGKWYTYELFQENIRIVKKKIIPVKSKSVDAAEKFKGAVDFIFIDGDHSYQAVKSDVDSWFNKLEHNGLIIMHDIGWADGVIKVIEEDIKPNLIEFNNLPNMFWGWKK